MSTSTTTVIHNCDRLLIQGNYNENILWRLGPINQTSDTGDRYVSYLEAVVRSFALLTASIVTSGFRIYICDHIEDDKLQNITKPLNRDELSYGALTSVEDFEALINNGVSLTWNGTYQSSNTISDVYKNKRVTKSYSYINTSIGDIAYIDRNEFDILSIILHPGFTDSQHTDGMGIFFLYNKIPLTNDNSTTYGTYPIVIDYIETPYVYVIMPSLTGPSKETYDLNVMQWNLDYDYYIYKDIAKMCYSGELDKIQDKLNGADFITEWYPNSYFPLKKTSLLYDTSSVSKSPIVNVGFAKYDLNQLNRIEIEIGVNAINTGDTIHNSTNDYTDTNMHSFVYIGTLKQNVYAEDKMYKNAKFYNGYSPNIVYDPLTINKMFGFSNSDYTEEDGDKNKTIFDTGLLFTFYIKENTPIPTYTMIQYRITQFQNGEWSDINERSQENCSQNENVYSMSILLDKTTNNLNMYYSYSDINQGVIYYSSHTVTDIKTVIQNIFNSQSIIVYGSTYPRNFYVNPGYKPYLLTGTTGRTDLANSESNIKWKSLFPYNNTYNFDYYFHDNNIILPYNLCSNEDDSMFLEIEVPNPVTTLTAYYVFIGEGIGFRDLVYSSGNDELIPDNDMYFESESMKNGYLYIFTRKQINTTYYPCFIKYTIVNGVVSEGFGGISGSGGFTFQYSNVKNMVLTIAKNSITNSQSNMNDFFDDYHNITFTGSVEQVGLKITGNSDKTSELVNIASSTFNTNLKTIALCSRYIGSTDDMVEGLEMGSIKLNFGPTSNYPSNQKIIDDLLANDNGGGGSNP